MPECILVLFVPHPNKYPYGIRKDLAAQLRTLPIYTSRSYDHNLRDVVSVPADKHKIQEIYKSISGPFVPAHTNGPHVSYATRVTYMQFPTYSPIHYRPL